MLQRGQLVSLHPVDAGDGAGVGEGDAFSREIGVTARGQLLDSGRLALLASRLMGCAELQLVTGPVSECWPAPGVAARQLSLKGSRKIVQPLLATMLEEGDLRRE